ncbi:MAG: winged helix-turn-helix domain-containing protein [Pseudomonadota bacterium]
MSNVRTWKKGQDEAFELRGRFVDPARRTVVQNGRSAEVEPRVMAVLLVLAERAGDTVRREELIDRVWNGAPGADQSLNNAISLLRRALRDNNGEEPPIVTTVPKQGYRLEARVVSAGSPAVDAASDAAAATGPATAGRSARPALAWLVAIVAVTVTTAWLWHGSDTADRTATVPAQSIAVLAFENLSPDPDDAYFADGLAEELTHTLSQVRSIDVASRPDSFQFRGDDASIGAIAQALGVANVLQGSVRREGPRLRITAQLVSAADNTVLWSTTYDRPADEMLNVQQDIAVNITNALVDEINGTEALAALSSIDPEAYEHYLIGKHELRNWTPDGNRRAVRYLERAVARDPDFAEARLALGRAYYFAGTHYGWMPPEEAIPKVKSSVVFGISAPNPATRAAALSIYGDVLAWGDRDWTAALLAYRRAYELTGVAPLGFGLTNSILGRHDEAIAIFQNLLAEGTGPIGINEEVAVRNNLAWAYFNARRYSDALTEARRVLAADDTFADAYRVLGRAQLMLGDATAAYDAFSAAATLMNDAAVARSDQAVALIRSGREGEARRLLADLESMPGYVPPPLIAQIYVHLGEHDTAMRWIRKGIDDGERGAVFLGINPLYDPIRPDPRFQAVLSELNLES